MRDCKQEAGFYNAGLSEQKYGPQQGSCRPLAAEARSLDFQCELGGWGTGLGQKGGTTHFILQGPQCTLPKSLVSPSAEPGFCWSQSEEFAQFLSIAHAKVGKAQYSVPWLVL